MTSTFSSYGYAFYLYDMRQHFNCVCLPTQLMQRGSLHQGKEKSGEVFYTLLPFALSWNQDTSIGIINNLKNFCEATLPQHNGPPGSARRLRTIPEGTLRTVSVVDDHMVLTRVTHIVRHSNRPGASHARGRCRCCVQNGSHSSLIRRNEFSNSSSLEIGRMT